MKLLAIETSCDETALALFTITDNQPKLVSEVVSSQIDLHAQYGGVVPELASREHLRNLPLLCDQLLVRAGWQLDELDYVAVTTGPGLKGCLLTGKTFAEGLVVSSNAQLMAVNHIEAHLYCPFMCEKLEFPFLALIVSGGHTELVLVKSFADYKILERTKDDAAGEAYDKAGNLLGLSYPGGAELAKLADASSGTKFTLPKVMRESEGYSFSGLKTAISLLIKKELGQEELQPEEMSTVKSEIAFAVQSAINDALVFKLQKAIKEYSVSTVVLSGGVSANKNLQTKISKISGVRLLLPSKQHYTDNAGMIGYIACLRIINKKVINDLEIRARWWLEEL